MTKRSDYITRAFLALVGLLIWANVSVAAVALVDDTTATPTGNGDISQSFTNNCATNCFLVMLMARGLDADPTCTFNGVGLTLKHQLNSSTANPDAEIHGLVAPASGANTFACSGLTTGPVPWSLRLLTFSGVDQATPWGTCDDNESSNATSSSLSITSAVGGMVVDVIGIENAFGTAPTAGAGQTDTDASVNCTGSCDMVSSTEAGAASVTMSWTTIAAFTDFVHIACPINAASTRRPIAPMIFQ